MEKVSTVQVIASAMGSVHNVPKGDRMGLRVSLQHSSYNKLFGKFPDRRFMRPIVGPNPVYPHN